jgi:hypothetical protein
VADTPPPTGNAQQVPHKQHLISQALLRAWVDPATGQLSCYDVRYRKSSARTTAQVGYVADFIKDDAAAIAAEQRWAEIENEIPGTLGAVLAGEGLVTDEVGASIRRMIALHWARSETALGADELMRDQAIAATKRRMVEELRPQMAVDFYRERKIYPVGDGALQYHAEHSLNLDEAQLDRMFAERVHENYDQALALLQPHAIEIIEAPEGSEFVLSDIVSLTLSKDKAYGGPLRGIRWDEATTIMLPLGPHHLATMGPKPIRTTLEPGQVEQTNRAQVWSSVKRVMYRPNPDMDAWIAAALPTPAV